MISCAHKLFLITLFGIIGCETENTCNDSCATKIYGDSFLSATFKAKQVNGISLLTIRIDSSNHRKSIIHSSFVTIRSLEWINKYHCLRYPFKYRLGHGNQYISAHLHHYESESTDRNSSFTFGSAMQREYSLTCSWTISRVSNDWPTDDRGTKLDLEFYPHYALNLGYRSTIMIETNTKDLPIYHLNYLRCCSKVYGDDKIQLFVKQTDYLNEFTLLLMDDASTDHFRQTSVKLTGSHASQLVFECSFALSTIHGFLKVNNETVSIDSQFLYRNNESNRTCSWSIPIVIRVVFGDYNTKDRVYDLQISDGINVYSENAISLKLLDSPKTVDSNGSSQSTEILYNSKMSGSTQISNIFIVFLSLLFSQVFLKNQNY